jgi:hypothetical protein
LVVEVVKQGLPSRINLSIAVASVSVIATAIAQTLAPRNARIAAAAAAARLLRADLAVTQHELAVLQRNERHVVAVAQVVMLYH